MRLDAEQTSALEYALNLVTDEVYLFGSRLDPAKKGGDIDLLVFSQQDSFQLSQQITLRFFEKCEEKIDVVVMDPSRLTEEQQAFLNLIEKQRLK
ncbi:TPA: nucleotidyltransferase domain-containing protein [Candidatus Poribacteria bacterium]|jgi:predicted nucleotidyltransferase|nr:nucleotidyltransferase domain-containing protein [Candidatus Poribacteria bacterium]HIO06175.1 nucleotidyltransferase domain-containing protein [Candidatus Poribacteria bacterium]